MVSGEDVDAGDLGRVVNQDRHGGLVRHGAEEEHLGFGAVHQVAVLMGHRTEDGVRAGAGGGISEFHGSAYAFLVISGMRVRPSVHMSGKAQKLQFLFGVEQGTFSASGNNKSGERRSRLTSRSYAEF